MQKLRQAEAFYLQYFKPEEYGIWWDRMSVRQMLLLDVFRHMVGSRVFISAAEGALGRELGPESESTHNVDYWGEVLASDVFVDHVFNRIPVAGLVDTATRIGFTGIGVYTDTRNNQGKPQPMLHLDSRPTRKMGQPAIWGRVAGQYCSIEKAINSIPR